ncbi:MAG: hypothetical protein M3165_10770 [Actinomycetota bacterium]|nr:hypothetical protein [Actinomycetota bacterium]
MSEHEVAVRARSQSWVGGDLGGGRDDGTVGGEGGDRAGLHAGEPQGGHHERGSHEQQRKPPGRAPARDQQPQHHQHDAPDEVA